MQLKYIFGLMAIQTTGRIYIGPKLIPIPISTYF